MGKAIKIETAAHYLQDMHHGSSFSNKTFYTFFLATTIIAIALVGAKSFR